MSLSRSRSRKVVAPRGAITQTTFDLREFIDALRAVLGKKPLYFGESEQGIEYRRKVRGPR